jgi:glutathione synthase/RimK-type ligase-like ATP-grasp enzyme
MKRIGVLFGQERTFPEAFCQAVNSRDVGVSAEPIQVEALRHDAQYPYDVIVDRISHEVPYYQMFLKQCALLGTRVINNPFWRIADDKYFGTVLAARLGVAVPKTLLLPQREYVPDIKPESLTNLLLVDWERIGAEVGFPCYIKPATGGGWKSVSRCDDVSELLQAFSDSGELVMMLQENIQWEAYARLLCIGKEEVLIAPWDPTKPHHLRYTEASFAYGEELEHRMIEQARDINRALGYDMNTVEFAIRDGIPYAIDFTNTAPDFDRNSLTGSHFDWVVEKMTDLAIHRAHEEPPHGQAASWKELLR